MALARGGPLPRRTPLRRGSPLRRSRLARLAPMSAARRAELVHRDAIREQVFTRDGHRCLLEHRPDLGGGCRGRLTPHHLQKASQGGPYTLTNLVTLCGHHNGWVEDRPIVAHSVGLVVRAGETVALAWQRLRAAGLVEGD